MLDVGFGMGADAGCAESYVALLWVKRYEPLAQKLERSSFGCKSQNVRLKSNISISKTIIDGL
jgi:hypothetical protein